MLLYAEEEFPALLLGDFRGRLRGFGEVSLSSIFLESHVTTLLIVDC
jgi:hypothetical protein